MDAVRLASDNKLLVAVKGGGHGVAGNALHGLNIDNLLSVDIAPADGQLCCASETKNEDLFWAVQGGGGNFGVITSFEFQLHPLGPIVMFCSPMYAAAQVKEVLRVWREKKPALTIHA